MSPERAVLILRLDKAVHALSRAMDALAEMSLPTHDIEAAYRATVSQRDDLVKEWGGDETGDAAGDRAPARGPSAE